MSSELQSSEFSRVDLPVKSINDWLRHLELNWWNQINGLYNNALIASSDKADTLIAALEAKDMQSHIEDVTGLLEVFLNQRLLETEIDELKWGTVFLGLYPLIQTYAMAVYIEKKSQEKSDPYPDLAKEIRLFATWMHVYFS